MIALLYAVWRAQGHKPRSRVQGVPALAALLMLSGGVVFLIYAIPAFLHGASTGVGRAIPSHPFIKGLLILRDLNTMGHPSYLFGEVRTHGWWYYFPVAFAVKMPTATLAFLALAALTCLRKLRHAPLRRIGFDWFFLAVPIVIFSAFPLFSPFDLGIRYLLPIWPFLFILAAAAFTRAQWRHPVVLLLGFGAALAAESIAIYPHYLAFFNVLAGGPAHGPAILADSNIDWGQDAKNLAAWLRAHPPARLTVDYWGSASLARLGVTAPSIMDRLRAEGRLPQDATAAVSVNLLVGLSPDRGHFGWLRGCPPRARIGYSIYVFDLAQCVPLVESRLSGAVRPAFRGVQHGDFRGAPHAPRPRRTWRGSGILYDRSRPGHSTRSNGPARPARSSQHYRRSPVLPLERRSGWSRCRRPVCRARTRPDRSLSGEHPCSGESEAGADNLPLSAGGPGSRAGGLNAGGSRLTITYGSDDLRPPVLARLACSTRVPLHCPDSVGATGIGDCRRAGTNRLRL